jgi:hypothetical protein
LWCIGDALVFASTHFAETIEATALDTSAVKLSKFQRAGGQQICRVLFTHGAVSKLSIVKAQEQDCTRISCNEGIHQTSTIVLTMVDVIGIRASRNLSKEHFLAANIIACWQ